MMSWRSNASAHAFTASAFVSRVATSPTWTTAFPPWSWIAVVILAVVLGAVAFFALFAREDPVCWARNPSTGESFRLDADRFVHGASISMDSRDLPRATEAGCSSDSISTGEAIAGTAVVAAMLGAVWVLSKPPEPRARPAPTIG